MKLLLHVNYYEGLGKLPKLLDTALRLGYDGVELRARYQFADMSQEEYRNYLADYKQAHPEFVFVFGLQFPFCRGTEQEVKDAETFNYDLVSWANKNLGSSLFNGFTGNMVAADGNYMNFGANGSGMVTDEDYARSAAGLRRLSQVLASCKARVALETHNCYLHDMPDACRRLMDECSCDNVGLNYDHGNMILNPKAIGIADVFDKIGDKMFYAHLKNVHKIAISGGYTVCRLSDGCINTRFVLEKLTALPLVDTIAVEYPCPGDGIYAARKDMEYMKELFADLGL